MKTPPCRDRVSVESGVKNGTIDHTCEKPVTLEGNINIP